MKTARAVLMVAALTAAAGVLGATGASASPAMIFRSTSQGAMAWLAATLPVAGTTAVDTLDQLGRTSGKVVIKVT
ncbi:hypothetical protein OG943_10215 [Amycolatopsis sp. NBC_00345]|uniref:hypothetical protein n=1 Tax=Amycolatopsis sp. NBC_00345 TaxID=2975955 RepID=UPI002E26C918